MTTQTQDRPAVAARRWQMLIGGEWLDAEDGATFERKSPASGETVGAYPNAGEVDVIKAVSAARKSFDDGAWANAPAPQKVQVLRKTADLLRANAQSIGVTIAQEMGKPVTTAIGEVMGAAGVFDYYAGIVTDLKGDAITQQHPNAIGLIVREPVGVVGIITPWNFPVLLVSWKLAPALAAGCSVVIKPSHHTPGSTLELGRLLLEAGLPAGVCNVITSETDNGAVAGQAMARSPLVDKIAFTGSTATGRKVMETASGTLKRVSLELGGKSPNIVFADAPSLDAAVAGAYSGIYLNAGQVCQAGSRLLVQESIKDEFLDKLVTMTRNTVKLGDPMDQSTNMGPIVSESQLAKVMSYIEAGKESARLVTGGARATGNGLDRGLYVEPTIFDEVSNDSRIAQEEIFGPVLSVLTFKDAEEGLRIANDTMYGLAAAVWTRDINVAFKLAKAIKAGTVWVNSYHSAGLSNMPFGGYKQSGVGRELGHEGIGEFLETKSIQIRLS